LTFQVLSCKDKNESKPADTAILNDIIGSWISFDSFIVKRNNKYEYYHDTLIISKDTVFHGIKAHIILLSSGSFYLGKYFGSDSLHLSYLGPTSILVKDPFRHKIFFNKSKDSISIVNFSSTYPGHFNDFRKYK